MAGYEHFHSDALGERVALLLNPATARDVERGGCRGNGPAPPPYPLSIFRVIFRVMFRALVAVAFRLSLDALAR